MARNVYGLDLGSYEIKVYDKKKDTIWKEKDVIALKNEKEIFAVGDEAFSMYEKAPSNIEVVFPMKEGVISSSFCRTCSRRTGSSPGVRSMWLQSRRM